MIFLGIGSSLKSKFGDRYTNIKKTIDLISGEKIKIKKISSYYETPSYPNKLDPKFINVVIEIDFKGNSEDLMKKLLLIEKKLERTRQFKNEPRTCDIDIIDFNGSVSNKNDIFLPHPKISERNFILIPLREICPMWIHPILNMKIDDLINNLSLRTRNEITRVKECDIRRIND